MNYELIGIISIILMSIALAYAFYDTIRSLHGGSFTKKM